MNQCRDQRGMQNYKGRTWKLNTCYGLQAFRFGLRRRGTKEQKNRLVFTSRRPTLKVIEQTEVYTSQLFYQT